jgi:biopolymer transport protein ExbB/TolQ
MKLLAIWKNFKKFVKNYWQLLVGLSIAIIVVILKRDSSFLKKALAVFREGEKERREEMNRVYEDDIEKRNDAIDNFIEESKRIDEEAEKRKDILDDKNEMKVEDLLEKEKNTPGTIASEIDKEVN